MLTLDVSTARVEAINSFMAGMKGDILGSWATIVASRFITFHDGIMSDFTVWSKCMLAMSLYSGFELGK